MKKNNSLNTLIATTGGNHYYASRSKPQIMLLHPILKHLIALKQADELSQWLAQLPGDETAPISIGESISVTRQDIDYYYRYMQCLEEKDYFSEVETIPMTAARFNADDVFLSLANTQQLVFETTQACQLKCRYCGFGDLYSDDNLNRGKQDLNKSNAKLLLDYLVKLWNSPLNRKYYKKIALSFYGGEPLLNFPLIEEIVRYSRNIKMSHNEFYYTMTTNGLLLDQYMDFLAENKFMLLISLDGNELNNVYRCFPDGSPSFQSVYGNILKLREKYPDYFNKSVIFASVLHDKNSTKELRRFFEEKFQKSPLLMEVNPIGIQPDKMDDYKKIFNWNYSDYTTDEILADIRKKSTIFKTPFVTTVSSFLNQYSGCVFKSHHTLIEKDKLPSLVSTGTCIPFDKKIFLTANGHILPCERILHKYSLGSVDETGVHLDFKAIADKYNRYYERLMNHCNVCGNSDACPICIFSLDLDADCASCNLKMDEETYRRNLALQLSAIEDSPMLYTEIMKNYKVQ